jgi:glutamate dehydrogenase/leucine dehydrogenase
LREKKKEQEFIRVLSGTKEQMLNFNKLIIKRFKNPYIAGVLSFEEENIEEQKNLKLWKILKMAFAGVPQDFDLLLCGLSI